LFNLLFEHTMQTKIGLQISGSDPGFTIFFSVDWEGECLTHSSERKNSVEPVYYEAWFGTDFWTYVAVYCNFLSNVNREECLKIGLRFPARCELTDSEGQRVSPASVLSRIYESVKSTALTRRGADTYRLRPDAVFDAVEYTSIFEEYTLRPVWGVTAESKENGSDVFMELRGDDPAEPLLHVPYLVASSEGAKVCIGSFSDTIDKYLFSPVDMRAEPFVRVNVEGRDRFYDYVIEPGGRLQIKASDCGYPEDMFEEVSVLFDCDSIVTTCGKDIGSNPGDGVSYYADAEAGVIFVKFSPKSTMVSCDERPLTSLLTVRIPSGKETVRSFRIRIGADDNAGSGAREISCPYKVFRNDGSDMAASVEIADLESCENVVVSLDNPATAECIAFRDDSGVYVADFCRHGRKRSLGERFFETMGFGSGSAVSGPWQIVRWLVIIAFAALLVLGGTVLAKFAGSVIDGALPFIDKIK